MTYTAIREEVVGTFMSNNITRYNLSPPCNGCQREDVLVDDYWTGEVECRCGEKLFSNFTFIHKTD